VYFATLEVTKILREKSLLSFIYIKVMNMSLNVLSHLFIIRKL